jgi:hypothetical protein
MGNPKPPGPPFYVLDEDTVDLLGEVLQYAITLADIQLCGKTQEEMYGQIAEIHERFNLPEVSFIFNIDDDGDHATLIEDADDSTVVPFHRRFGRPNFGVIKGGKDDGDERD